MNPNGNTTIFILDPVEKEQYSKIAKIIMQKEYLCAEQVGFIKRNKSACAEPERRVRHDAF